MTSNKINPPHYDGDACMRKIAEITSAMPGAVAFCVGQAIKYLWRTNRKAGEDADTDAAKALWYLDWIKHRQQQQHRDYIVCDREDRIIASLRMIAHADPASRREKVQTL